MVGSKDLPPNLGGFGKVFYNNQFRAHPTWPAKDTDLSGKTAIITGSNTGLGYEAAVQLLSLKLSSLVLAVRSLEKGDAAAAKLQKLYPAATLHVWELDMCSYPSIQAFATRVGAELSRIDYVVLNAGLSAMKYNKIEETGHEEVFQVNYLSTTLLTILLLPIIASKGPPASPARLIIVNAALALLPFFKINKKDNVPLFAQFDDPKKFSMDKYNESKMLAHAFLWKLVDHVSADDVIITLVDPSYVRGTEFGRFISGSNILLKVGMKLFEQTGRTPRIGASTFIDALVNKGKESHGCFLMSWKIEPFNASLYTPEGKVVIEKIWEETMAEFEFAGVKGILEGMKMSVK